MAKWLHSNKGNTMLIYLAYSFCPAHGTNVLRQKFRYYFITSNGIIIPIQNLIGPVHILKYSAMLLYKLLWTRQWAFWSLILHWSNNPHFKWKPLWTQSESLNCSGLSQSRQDRKVRFGVWLNLFELSQEELICSSSVEKSWVFGVWGDLFPQIITDSTTAGGNPRFLQNLPLQRNTNNTSESGQCNGMTGPQRLQNNLRRLEQNFYETHPKSMTRVATAHSRFLELVPVSQISPTSL